MKKVKKNNKPLIILLVGLLLSGCLIGYSIYGINQHNKYLIEHRAEFDKKVQDDKKECNEGITKATSEIERLKNEMDVIDNEITLLQREQSKVFREDRGFSDRYYSYDDQMSAKRKEKEKKRLEIHENEKLISNFDSTIWEIENEFDEYKYKKPGFKKANPYLFLVFGIFVGIITIIVSSVSKLFKIFASEKSYSEYKEIDEGILSRADINDGKIIKKDFFEKIKKLLLASSNDDKDTIRKLCTNTMAKSYMDEIDLLNKYKQKQVVKNIEDKGSKIIDVRKNQHHTVVVLLQRIKMIQYTKDVNTNRVVSGDDKKEQTIAFKLVFVKNFGKEHNLKKCPNCGANIKDGTKLACDYCGTSFDNSNYDWYLASKVIINED